MTPEEHQKKSAILTGKITRARNAAKAMPSLHEKLAKREEVKKLEEELHQHQLNYFELVPTSERVNLYPHQRKAIEQLLKTNPAVMAIDVCRPF